MPQVYLDHQSATPVLPEVLEAMLPWFADSFGNPSSLHRHGLLARDAIAKSREQIAAFINAQSAEEIIFTSDGTESAQPCRQRHRRRPSARRQPHPHHRHRTPLSHRLPRKPPSRRHHLRPHPR